VGWMFCNLVGWASLCNLECWVLSLISSGGVVGCMSAMEGDSVCPQAGVGSSS
jgi:hypothetical protein